MGFLFQNISQLAGFLMNESGDTSKSIQGIGENSETVDFQTILESMSSPKSSSGKVDSDQTVNDLAYFNTLLNSNFGAIMGIESNLNTSIEVKERAGINADLLTVLVTNQKDSVTLNLPQASISKLVSGNLPEHPVNFQAADLSSDIKSDSADLSSVIKPENNVGLTFNLKELLNSKANNDILVNRESLDFSPAHLNTETTIPIITNDNYGISTERDVKIGDLFQLLREYPDPIDMEIGDLQDSIMVPDKINPANSKLVSSTFRFDLRDLLSAKSQEKIPGILTTSEKPAQISNEIINAPKYVAESQIKYVAELPISGESEITLSPKFEMNLKEIQAPVLFDPPQFKANLLKNNIYSKLNIKEKNSGEETIAKPVLNRPAEIQSNSQSRFALSNNPEPPANDDAPHSASWQKIQFVSLHKNANQNNSSDLATSSKQEKSATPKPESESGLATPIDTIENLNGETKISLNTNTTLIDDVQIDQEQITANVREIKNVILESFGQKNGLVRMKLHPDNLGEISIRLLWKDSGLTVTMKAENKESHKILTAGAADLKGSLEAANFKVNEVYVATQSDWDGKSLHASGQELSGDHKQSRQQKESANDSPTRRQGQWESDDKSKDTQTKQRANSWVDLTA